MKEKYSEIHQNTRPWNSSTTMTRKVDTWFDFCGKMRQILTNINKRVGLLEARPSDENP